MQGTYSYLSTIIETGNLSKAAELLGVSQPYLSQFLLRLERKHGVKLIDRSAKPLQLTDAGRIILDTEKAIEDLRKRCHEEVLDISAGIKGKVTIGASHYRERFFLTQVLPIFRERYPQVEIQLQEGTTYQLEQFVLEGKSDFSLVIEPVSFSQLDCKPIYQERLLIALNAEHPLCRQTSDTLDFSLLNDHPFIVIKEGQMMRRFFRELCKATGATPKIVMESESPEAALSLCSVGLGATITTETLVKRSNLPGNIRAFEIQPSQPARTVVAAFHKQRYLSKAAQKMIELMQEVGTREFING